MKQPGNLQNLSYDDTWQQLDQLSLPGGSFPAELIVTWLSKILAPLNVYPGLLEKINVSFQEDTSSPDFLPVRLRLFIPRSVQGSQPSSRNWGFYRVGKANGMSEDGQTAASRSVEIYLYPEG